MNRPKTVQGIFATIGNELRQTVRSVVSSKPLFHKLGVVVGFAARTIANVTHASVIALESKDKKARRKAEILKYDRAELIKKRRREEENRQNRIKNINARTVNTEQPAKTEQSNAAPKYEPYVSLDYSHRVNQYTEPDLTKFAYNQAKLDDLKSVAKYRFRYTELSDIMRENREPKPFFEPRNGEACKTKRCRQAHCEGNGEFVVTVNQDNWYKTNLGNFAESCYPCRYWKYQIAANEWHTETCNKCHNQVTVTSKVWIGYHTYIGKPTAEVFCKNCKKSKREGFLIDEPEEYHIYGYLAGLRSKLDSDYQTTVSKRQFRTWMLQKLELRDYSVSMTNLVDVSYLEDSPDSYHPYHTLAEWDIAGQSAYSHLADHVIGSSRQGRVRSADFLQLGPPAKFIKHAHDVVREWDLDRYMDFLQTNGKIMRCDFAESSVYIVGEDHLVTAYKPANLTDYIFEKYSKGQLVTQGAITKLKEKTSRKVIGIEKTTSDQLFCGKPRSFFENFVLNQKGINHIMEEHLFKANTELKNKSYFRDYDIVSLLDEALTQRLDKAQIINTTTGNDTPVFVVTVNMEREIGLQVINKFARTSKRCHFIKILIDKHGNVYTAYPCQNM